MEVTRFCYSIKFLWKRRELLTSCDLMPTDSKTIWEVSWKLLSWKLLKKSFGPRGRLPKRKLGGEKTISVKVWVRKTMFGRLGRRWKSVKRNTWLSREDLNMLCCKKSCRGKEVSVHQCVITEFSELRSRRKRAIRMFLEKAIFYMTMGI